MVQPHGMPTWGERRCRSQPSRSLETGNATAVGKIASVIQARPRSFHENDRGVIHMRNVILKKPRTLFQVPRPILLGTGNEAVLDLLRGRIRMTPSVAPMTPCRGALAGPAA